MKKTWSQSKPSQPQQQTQANFVQVSDLVHRLKPSAPSERVYYHVVAFAQRSKAAVSPSSMSNMSFGTESGESKLDLSDDHKGVLSDDSNQDLFLLDSAVKTPSQEECKIRVQDFSGCIFDASKQLVSKHGRAIARAVGTLKQGDGASKVLCLLRFECWTVDDPFALKLLERMNHTSDNPVAETSQSKQVQPRLQKKLSFDEDVCLELA